MTLITLECARCSTVADVPALSVFVEVDGPDLAAEEPGGVLHWTCGACADVVALPVSWPALAAVLRAGAWLVEPVEDDPRPLHPEAPAPGAAFVTDDLLALHELLAGDTWFDELTGVPGDSSHV